MSEQGTPERPTAGAIEERTAGGVSVDGRRIRGVVPYGVESRDLGGWREVIEPTAFRDTKLDELRVTIDHKGVPLGRYPKTLDVEDGDAGLQWALDPPRSRDDVVEAVARGDMRAGSWRMVVGKDRWQGDVRHVETIAELLDVCLVGADEPAYPAATVELRTRPEPENNEPAETAEKEDTMEAEDRQTGVGLAVEDRTASTEARTLEQRMFELVRDTPRGEARSLTTSVPTSQPEISQQVFDKLRAASVVLRSGVRVISTDSESVKFPAITGDVSPAWYSEGATIVSGDPTLAEVEATPRKFAHIIEVTNELVEDSSPAILDVLRQHLTSVIASRLDFYFLEGSGTAPEIRGLKNVSGIQAVTAVGSFTDLDWVAEAIRLLEVENVAGPYVLVTHPRALKRLRTIREDTGATVKKPLLDGVTAGRDIAPSVYGIPVLASSALPVNEGGATNENSAYIFAPSEVYVVNRVPVEIEADRSRLFHQDKTEVRVRVRVDLVVPRPKAVVRAAGIRA